MSATVRVFSVLSWVVLFVAPLLGTPIARADCLPIAYTRYVGNTTTDTLCTENDIQSAINNSVCPTTIYVSNERAWTAQHLDINNKNLTIVGRSGGCGTQTCDGGCAVPTAPVVVLSGSGHSGDSVMYIHGTSNITLKYLDIKNGNNINGAANTYGGGIHFDGKGSLVLDTTWVRNNVARYGGGINMSGTSGFAGLTVLGGTRIENNSAANSGGGIRITDNTFMSILYDHTLIWLNQAPDGYGGGINIVGPAHADIGSPGESGIGVLYSNSAKYGGGIAMTTGDSSQVVVNLFGTDPVRPVRVQGNSATAKGGAIYVKPYIGASGLGFASLCALDFRIDDSAAPEGSGIYLDNDSSVLDGTMGSSAYLNGGCGTLPAAAQRCTAGIACNTVSNNAAVDAANTSTSGATIFLAEDSSILANRLSMHGNRGGYAVRITAAPFDDTALINCLFAGNQVTRNLISVESGALRIDSCTVVNNSILSTDAIHAEGPFTLNNSILDVSGNLALAYSGGSSNLHVSYVLSTDVSTLPGTGVLPGQPTYVNFGAGDYHLALNSLGVDFAPSVPSIDRDLDMLPRDQDLPEVANLSGPRDLGAYERQRTFACGAADTIFCDGFNN